MLERYRCGTAWRVTTVECSACGYRFGRGRNRGQLADHLLTDHTPDDFGLAPLGERGVA